MSEAFAPFGDVMEVSEANQIIPINYGNTERHHNLAKVDVADESGEPSISIFRSVPVQLPFQIKIMERHPLGSQAFMPLSGNPYVVVVARVGELDPKNLQAFIVQSHQGVNYHKGTWHHYCLGLNVSNDFLVVDRHGQGPNCDEVEISQELEIYVDY